MCRFTLKKKKENKVTMMAIGLLGLTMMMTTAAGEEDVLPCRGTPVVPSLNVEEQMELIQVQILTRHGARTSVFQLPGNGTNDDVEWQCHFDHFDSVDTSPKRKYRKVYLKDVEYLRRGNCADGQLTSHGASQHVDLGRAYRERYVQRLNISLDGIFVRSTDVPRVFASVQSNLAGMFPPENDSQSTSLPNIYTVDNPLDEMAQPNNICPLGQKIAEKRADDDDARAYLAKRKEELTTILGKFNLSDFDMWTAVAIADQIVARKCSMNEPKLPNGATYEDARTIFDVAAWLSFHELNSTQMRRLSIGLLTKEMVNNIEEATVTHLSNTTTTTATATTATVLGGAAHTRAKPMVFFSAHDTTVYPLLNAFGAWSSSQFSWPPFTSHIELELWASKSPPSPAVEKSLFVRLSYNGRVLTIYDCEEMCPLSQFRSLMGAGVVPKSRASYIEECAGSSVASFPDSETHETQEMRPSNKHAFRVALNS